MKRYFIFTVVFLAGIHVAFAQNVVGNSSYRDPTATGSFRSNEAVAFREHFSTAANARAEYNRRGLVNQDSKYVEQFRMVVQILVRISSSGRMTNHGIMTVGGGMLQILIIDGDVVAVGAPAWLLN